MNRLLLLTMLLPFFLNTFPTEAGVRLKVKNLSPRLRGIVSEQRLLLRRARRLNVGYDSPLRVQFEKNMREGFELSIKEGLVAGMPLPGKSFAHNEMEMVALLSGSRLQVFDKLARYDSRSLDLIQEAGGFFPHIRSAGLPIDHINNATGTFVGTSIRDLSEYFEKASKGTLKRNLFIMENVEGFYAPQFIPGEREVLTSGITFDKITQFYENLPSIGKARKLQLVPIE